MPKKPVLFMCQLDLPAEQGICGNTQGETELRKAIGALDPLMATPVCPEDKSTLPQGVICREPLSNLDKATMFAPPEWMKAQNYIDQLEAWGKEKCK
jgi:hypothetical protein